MGCALAMLAELVAIAALLSFSRRHTSVSLDVPVSMAACGELIDNVTEDLEKGGLCTCLNLSIPAGVCTKSDPQRWRAQRCGY